MNHFNFLALVLAAASSLAAAQRCSNEDGLAGLTGEAPARMAKLKMREFQKMKEIETLGIRAPPPPPVELFVHILASSERREDGWLSAAEVDHQVEIIKNAYTPVGITFNHNPATQRKWTNEPAYTGDGDFNPMKEALREGDYKTLNLYLRPITTQDNGGTCTNPWTQSWRTEDPLKRFLQDGCVVNQSTLDGSNHEWMNKGLTAVHEIGHWFGLFHPWEPNTATGNPCSANNLDDHVADTPKMGQRGNGICDKTQNSCNAGTEGDLRDPIENYMSWSSDECYASDGIPGFTEGQKQRMYYIYDSFRTNFTRPTV